MVSLDIEKNLDQVITPLPLAHRLPGRESTLLFQSMANIYSF
jgi:alpha-beta hydrolase superfamily lysophospholipase